MNRNRPHNPQLCEFFRDLAPALLPAGSHRSRLLNPQGHYLEYHDDVTIQVVRETRGAQRDNFAHVGQVRASARYRLQGVEP